MTMTKKLEKRFEEMEGRRKLFLERYGSTGDRLFLELADEKEREMNELREAISKAKKKVIHDDYLWFERDYIAELLGFENFDELVPESK